MGKSKGFDRNMKCETVGWARLGNRTWAVWVMSNISAMTSTSYGFFLISKINFKNVILFVLMESSQTVLQIVKYYAELLNFFNSRFPLRDNNVLCVWGNLAAERNDLIIITLSYTLSYISLPPSQSTSPQPSLLLPRHLNKIYFDLDYFSVAWT